MDKNREAQYKKFLEEKDELIESLTKDFAAAFEKHGPASVWHIFTPVSIATGHKNNAG